MPKHDDDRFATVLRKLIDESPYPDPTAFARAAGIDPSTVSRWLRGADTAKSPTKLEQAAETLGVPTRALLEAAYPEQYQEKTFTVSAPARRLHPLAEELHEVLHRLPDQDRHRLAMLVDGVMEPYRSRRRKRATA